MEQLVNKYYQKGSYILYGNSGLRNGKIFCQFFSEEARIKLLEVLNKEENEFIDLLQQTKDGEV